MHNAEQMSPNNMKHVQSRKTLCAAQSAQYVGDGSHDIIHTVHPVYVQIFDFIGARALRASATLTDDVPHECPTGSSSYLFE